jgi:hypothetical protein
LLPAAIIRYRKVADAIFQKRDIRIWCIQLFLTLLHFET